MTSGFAALPVRGTRSMKAPSTAKKSVQVEMTRFIVFLLRLILKLLL
jgi:hypothetical protein